jgi:PAS domain S-box-containing protein
MKRVIDNRVAAGFFLGIAILAIVGWLSYRNTSNLVETTRSLLKTQQVLDALDDLLSAIKDAETGQRGYIITGRVIYLDPYLAATRRLDRSVQNIERLIAHDVQQQRRFAVIQPLVAEKIAEMQETIDIRRSSGFEAASRTILTDRGKDLMDRIREAVLEMRNAEEARLEDRAPATVASSHRTIVTMTIGSILSLMLLLGAFFLIRREMAERQRLETLAIRNAQELQHSRDELEIRVQERTSDLAETNAALQTEILQRRQADEALRESESRLRAIINTGPECVKLVDENGNLLEMNPAGLAMIEADSFDQVSGKSICGFMPEPHKTALAELIGRVFRGEAGALEFECVGLKGGRRWIETHCVPFRDQDGRIVAMLGIASDISQRKHIELELVESKMRMSGIIESAMDAIVTIDDSERIVLFNSAAEKMFRRKSEEVLGKPLEHLIPERFRAAHRSHIEQFGSAKVTSRSMGSLGAVYGLRDGGEEFPIEASISQMEAAGQKLFTVILRDITKRKRAEERLVEQAALLNHAQDAILVRDMDDKILFWNQGAERVYGWTADEVMGRDVKELLYRSDKSVFIKAKATVIEKGEWRGELSQSTKSGAEVTTECRLALVRDSEGKLKSVLSINTDVTERKKLEAQFLRAQRLESIGTLASGIAHDLNNIFSPITTGVQLLQMKISDESSQRMLEVIRQSAERGGDLIKQVLSFARGAEGRKTNLQPRHLIKEIVKVLDETFPKEITIKHSLPSDLAMIKGDPTQLHQVLMNLCVNARDAMPEGGSLTVMAENVAFDEHYAQMNPEAKPGPYVLVTVTDSGSGIPREIIDRIFDPFFTTKEQGKGTGLGLSTVLAIVKGHGGFVNVYSEAQNGTQFRIYLPAVASAQPDQSVAAKSRLPMGRGETILVVDDEPSVREITRTTLETFGYRVLTACEGAEAVALYVTHRDEVKAVLTDMMMPMMDGPATIRALMKINPQIPIIASSGHAESDRVAEAAKLGVKSFLPKPYTAEKLLVMLDGVVGGAMGKEREL